MRISSVQYGQKISLRGLKPNIHAAQMRGGGQTVTEHLWEHLRESLGMPPAGLYDGRKTDYEMERFLDELLPAVVRRNNLSEAEMNSLLSYNIKPISGTENSFRGPAKYSDIKLLEPNKLEFVYAEYIYNNVMGFIDEDPDVLVDFIKTMQKDNIYIGCRFGQKQTNYALAVNQYFNPMSKDTSHYPVNKYSTWNTFLDLCDALTPEQKKSMGWTEEFEANFRKKIDANIKWLNDN